jgi:hypothetical protein
MATTFVLACQRDFAKKVGFCQGAEDDSSDSHRDLPSFCGVATTFVLVASREMAKNIGFYQGAAARSSAGIVIYRGLAAGDYRLLRSS